MDGPDQVAAAPPPADLDEKRRLLLALLLEERGVDPLRAPILPVPRDGRPLPLSFGQERLWLIDQIEPGNVAYNTPSAMRLYGRLDPALLARTLTELVRRHETLRTTFAAGPQGPVQIVAPPAPVPLPCIDLADLPREAREAEARRLADAEAWQPFDLARGPVLRVRLLRMEGQEEHADAGHALLLTVHHITSDGWSTGILIREVMALYGAFAAGLPSPLPELPIQYADFAAWQRAAFAGEALARELGYWRRQLAGSGVLELPTDLPRPPEPGYEGGAVDLEIPAGEAAPLKALSRAAGTTTFMLLAAGWAALLARWSGVEDLNLGTPIANRRRSETEQLVGFLVNTLVVRVDLAGDPTFRELLARVRRVALQAFEHQDLPFSRIVEELRPERSLAQNPLFQVLFGMGNAPGAHLEIPGLAIEPLGERRRAAMFDLNLTAHEQEGMVLELEYRADLFHAGTARRLLLGLAALLAGAAVEPDRRLSDLPMLTPEERHALLVEWNDTAMPPPEELARALARGAARTPDAVAVAGEGEVLTYGELDARAARLAERLAAVGAGRGARVALAAGRSPAVLVGLLAVLRGGAAYVPLDPSYPRERLRRVLADAGAAALLAEQRLLAELPPFDGPVLPLDHLEPWPAAGPPPRPAPASPQDLAYVLYTSGSTGQPKGVAMTRGALAHLLAWQALDALPSPARTLQFASLAFDVSAQEIASTWLAGSALVLVAEETRRDPPALLAHLAREGVERLFLPFVALRALAEASLTGGRPTPALADVVTAGEALQVTPAVAAWLGRSGARLHNQYGPTETHVATAWTLDGDPAGWPPLPPIGRPVGGSRAVLLDARLAPVPLGAIGELCVGGAAPARGYLGRPGATAERFLPDAWGDLGEEGAPGAPSTRLYRTGDLARWLPDGRLQFAGRRDDQVKVRGVRVEPGEVEAALAEHPAVAQALVVPVPARTADGGIELAAFVVPRPGTAPVADGPAGGLAGELRERLRARLPEAFVPSRWRLVDALPLTPSGKVDRRALARLGGDGDAGAATSAAPRTATEELLAGIWAELLGRERVGVDDNFFDLGGHSLLATRVTSRVREAFGIELPQRALFEAPTLSDLARRVESACRQAAAGETASLRAPILPLPRDLPEPPLSFDQERLWIIQQLDPASPAYNLPTALRLTGRLRRDLLARALAEIVRRHSALRTTFGVAKGRPVQVVHPPGPVEVPLVDLAGLPAGAREAEARALAEQEAMRPFDLAAGPVLRASLIRLSAPRGNGAAAVEEEEHALLFTIHHIVSDGWSGGILVAEVAALYEAFSQGRPSPLPELPVQYVDYAFWQREALQGEALDAAIAHWRRVLAGGPPVLELPGDRPRPAVQSVAGAAEAAGLPSGLVLRLKGLARAEGATLFMATLAAYAGLLARWTGQTDVAVGTSVAGRAHREIEPLIGFFVNTLVLRTRLDGDPGFRALLARAREVSITAFAHAELPFSKLVAELNPERSLAHAPLFQVMFVLQNTPSGGPIELPDLSLAPLEAETKTAIFDLTLSLTEIPEGLVAALGYRTELFDAATARRLLGHYANLLAAATDDPERRLWDLPILGEAERQAVLVEWNDTAAGYPPGRTLDALIAEQAARTPEAVAVACEERALSFRALLERADLLAQRLHRLGVGPDVLVGVAMERSLELVVALVGILRAGGAYVPLDPSYPRERIAQMVEDARPPVLLTEERLAADLPTAGACVLALDTVWERASTLDGALPPAALRQAEVSADHLAYTIFTSGSTGRPKGAMNTHRAIVNRLLWGQEACALTPADRVLQKTPFSFDVSVWEFFWPLVTGARLVVARPGAHAEPAALVRAIAEEGITTVHFVPSVLASFLEEPGLAACASLARVIASGEALPFPLTRRFFALLPWAALHNLYGPTEAAVEVTWWSCDAASERPLVPIGRPVANARVHLLDAGSSPAPIGVTGELVIAGVPPARGYLGRPELTASSFAPDPVPAPRCGPDGARQVDPNGAPGARQVDPDGAPGARQVDPDGAPGARLYRTGDLARRLPSGEIDFLGRLDAQVKIRGLRIELGEIEAALTRNPAVAEAAVVVREGSSGAPAARRLVAYVVPAASAAGAELATSDGERLGRDVREALRRTLPEHMVPAAVVWREALPRTPSGKVDRRALATGPAPQAASQADGSELVAPRTPAEELVAGIWAEVLGPGGDGHAARTLSVRDNFFDLGGHSLLAAQVAARLRESFGVDLPLRRLFEAPTLEALAVEAAGGEARDAAPPLTAVPRDGHLADGGLALSFAQERLWFLDRLDPGNPAYNVPAAVRLAGRLDRGALAAALREVVRRHEVLRTVYLADRERPVARVLPAAAPGALPGLPLADLSALPAGAREAEARSLAVREARRPFDLEQGPVLRATLLRLGESGHGNASGAGIAEIAGRDAGEEEHVLFLTVPHIASDAWSAGVLVAELAALYGAFVSGHPSPLPPLPVQYADFAAWQRRWIQGEVLEAQLAWWRAQVAGAPEVLELPADRPRPPVPSFRGAHRPRALPAPVAAAARALGRRSGATLFMTALTAFAAQLNLITGEPVMLIGTTLAQRGRRELEGLIGFLINTLPLCADLSGDPSFRELLSRMREMALGAYAHGDLPFERLVEEVAPARDPSRSPLVQVFLQAHNTPMPDVVELPGLRLLPFGSAGEAAKFDLVVNLAETGDHVAADWLYAVDLFDGATVARMSGHFETLLAAAAADPGLRISELPLLAEAERHQLVTEWGDHGSCDTGRLALHDVFALCAAERPDAVALVAPGERVSYGALAMRARRIAVRLRALGVGRGTPVALLLERSPDLVAAVLGTLAAGGAYVPLDPAHPPERLARILEDAAAPVVVTDELHAVRLPATRARVLRLAEALRRDPPVAPAGEPEHREPPETAGPDDLAYVLYTSGSTGAPKGVMVRHGDVLRLLAATAPRFRFGAGDVWTLFHSYAFDFSVWELWGALAHGGALVVVPFAVSRSPRDFHTLLAEEGVTVLNQTPSAFRQLVWAEEQEGDRLPALCWVIFGGEALEPASLAPWFARHGDGRPRLVNMYGITETTVHVTLNRLRRADAAAPGSVVGRAIPDQKVHLLDAGLRPVPIGVAGELFVGGAGLAGGYLGRPDLTAERFLPDFLGGALGARQLDPGGALGARLYRSGDLARWLPDGSLEYLGRIDHQVKVRGFRIELAEIESALARHPAVREVTVLAREAAPGERTLIAYVAAATEAAPTLPELRAFLAPTLPDYMLPGGLVRLERLPLTPNGKVDRKALARLAPAAEAAAPAAAYEPPLTPLERFVAGLFRETLKVERVGRDDDFFALGGNSISGAVLINRLQEALGEIVQVVVIFDASTVARLAAHLGREHREAVARRWGRELADEAVGTAAAREAPGHPRVTASRLAELDALLPALAPLPPEPGKNPRAVFVLAPPRSGTTLLRVMLGGHPALFAPPELELLGFSTLAERRAAFTGRDAFWLEGAIRAVMEARHCGAEEARAIVEEGEGEGWSTPRFYRLLQEWVGGRTLVDKTPSYALDRRVLSRAEEMFAEPLYVHLVRHPRAVVRSFEEAKLDQLFFRRPHPFARRELAELVWLASQRNVLDFLAGVPAARQRRVRFEDLVRDPESVLSGLCAFLGLPYDPSMARPYENQAGRMTDGLHAASRMLGDVKFHQHRGVDAAAAERWRAEGEEIELGDLTLEMAARLGYVDVGQEGALGAIGGEAGAAAVPAGVATGPLVLLRRGTGPGRPLFWVHPVGGNVLCYADLARHLAPERSLYGLRSSGLVAGEPQETIEEMAATYLAAVAAVQPAGPYLLGGWSLGGVIAQEMARQLARRGDSVDLLMLIDSPVPGVDLPPLDDALMLAAMMSDLAGLSGRGFEVPPEDLRQADPDERVDLVLRRAAEAGLLPPGMDVADARRLMRVFTANRAAMARYSPGPAAGVVPGATEPPAILLRAADRPGPDLTAGWRNLLGPGLEAEELAGDHYSLLREPHVTLLAERLNRRLASA